MGGFGQRVNPNEAFIQSRLRPAATPFRKLTGPECRGPHLRKCGGVKVLAGSVSPPDDEDLEHIVGSVQKQSSYSRQVPFLSGAVLMLPDFAYKPRKRALHPLKSVCIDSKFASLQQPPSRRKHLEFSIEGLEFG
jgi:hypothetical protein